MKRRGATLIELLVVMTVFTVLLVIILSFYIYATKVSHSRDRVSVSYRKMITALDKVETLLSGAKLHYLDGHQILYSKVDPEQPYLPGAFPNFGKRANTLAVVKEANGKTYLVSHTEKYAAPLLEFGQGEAMVFQQSTDRVIVSVHVQLQAEQGAGVARSYSTSRSILTERY